MPDDGISEDEAYHHFRNIGNERSLSDIVDDDDEGAEEEEDPFTLRLNLAGEDISKTLYLWLTSYAAEEDRPVKDVVADAILEYLQRNDSK